MNSSRNSGSENSVRREAATSRRVANAKTRNGGKTVVNRGKQKAAANGALMRLRPLNVGARGAIMRLYTPAKGLNREMVMLDILEKKYFKKCV